MDQQGLHTRAWHARETHAHWGPPPQGALVAINHGVWRVAQVEDLPVFTDDDRQAWLDVGMPDIPTWRGRPHHLVLEHVGGHRPAGPRLTRRVAAVASHTGNTWEVYPDSGRWPMCSCCGEPMPCRAEIADWEVNRAARRMDELEARLPGCCWSCSEPITTRQRSVAYPGDNLDMPGGIPVRFHRRRRCWAAATRYERRWIDADPRNERILTWPRCGGLLVVHADGTSQCRPHPAAQLVPAGNCQGHLTHDHRNLSTCRGMGDDRCDRGCDHTERWGISRLAPRPERPAQGRPA